MIDRPSSGVLRPVSLALFVLLFVASAAPAQQDVLHTTTYFSSPAAVPREHPVDFQKLRLEVRFDTTISLVKGRVEHTFTVLQQRVDSIVFDAVSINIKQAMLNGRPARYRSTDTSVIVYCEPPLQWDQTGSVQFTYEATPRKGIYFVGWQDATGKMPRQIWTQGQAVDNRHWIPMYDDANDKMITETVITFDSSYTVISNGDLKGIVTNSDGSRTWEYGMRKPHSTYLMMIAIGKYGVTKDTSASGVPMELYWYADRPQVAEPTYRMSVEAMDFLEKRIGVPYPWGVYRQVPVADFIFGAMENTTATIFGDFYQVDARGFLDRPYVRTNVHELTHQWYGDLVTGRSLAHLWLQESFATFYPYLFAEAFYGRDEAEWDRRGMQNRALAAGEKNRIPIVHPEAGSDRVYPKGAIVLDMMRHAYGDSALHRVLKHYLNEHAFENVETNDLYQAYQDVLGIAPYQFFKQWLYQGGEPHFKITTGVSVTSGLQGASTSTVVNVDQVHPVDDLTGYFTVPVTISVHYEDGSMDTVRTTVSGPHTSVQIPNTGGKTVSFVLFDPGSTLLKRVTFDKNRAALMAQVRKAPHMIDRYDALVELAKDTSSLDGMLDVIESIMENEQHHGIRAEAVKVAIGMAQRGVEHAWKTVEAGLEDKRAEVRKAAINGMLLLPKRLEDASMALLIDSSYQVVASAVSRICTSYPERIDRVMEITKGIVSPEAVVELARLEVMVADGNAMAYKQLVGLCGPGAEFRTRQNAMRALKRTGQIDEAAAANLIEACLHTNGRLAGVAKEVVGYFLEQSRSRGILMAASRKTVLTPERRKALDDIIR